MRLMSEYNETGLLFVWKIMRLAYQQIPGMYNISTAKLFTLRRKLCQFEKFPDIGEVLSGGSHR